MLNLNMCVPVLSLDKLTTVIHMQDVKVGDTVKLAGLPNVVATVKRIGEYEAGVYTLLLSAINRPDIVVFYNSNGKAHHADILSIVEHTSVYVMTQQDWYKELSCDEARQMWLTHNVEVFKLYDDDSESVIYELDEFDDKTTRFGAHYSDLIH